MLSKSEMSVSGRSSKKFTGFSSRHSALRREQLLNADSVRLPCQAIAQISDSPTGRRESMQKLLHLSLSSTLCTSTFYNGKILSGRVARKQIT